MVWVASSWLLLLLLNSHSVLTGEARVRNWIRSSESTSKGAGQCIVYLWYILVCVHFIESGLVALVAPSWNENCSSCPKHDEEYQ